MISGNQYLSLYLKSVELLGKFLLSTQVMCSLSTNLSSLMEGREVFIGLCACLKRIIFSLWSYLYSLISLLKSIIYQDGGV